MKDGELCMEVMNLREKIINELDLLFYNLNNGKDYDAFFNSLVSVTSALKINLSDYLEFDKKITFDQILNVIREIKKDWKFKYKIVRKENKNEIIIHKKIGEWRLSYDNVTKETFSFWFDIHESSFRIYNLYSLKTDLLGWLTDIEFY